MPPICTIVLALVLVNSCLSRADNYDELRSLLNELDDETHQEYETPLDKLVDNVDHLKEQKQLSEDGEPEIFERDEFNDVPMSEDDEAEMSERDEFNDDKTDDEKFWSDEDAVDQPPSITDEGVKDKPSFDTDDLLLPLVTNNDPKGTENYEDESAVNYSPVGCYKDGGSRPLPELIRNFRGHIDWHDLNKTIRECAMLADSNGYSFFGLQFYGECWSGPDAEVDYEAEGRSENCVDGVGKQWTNYVYRIEKPNDPVCKNYKILDDETRSASFYDIHGESRCDSDLDPVWYRFTAGAGTNMVTSCVPQQRCGTHAPGWLQGSLPIQSEGRVERKVCFTWGDNCCYWSTNTIVRNCGGYYVYKLGKPPLCRLRYCGNGRIQEKLDDTYFSPKAVRSYVNKFKPIGCFLDNGGKNRPLPTLLDNFRSSIDWHNLNKTINACAHLAHIKGYDFFGIQFFGECWSGVNADQTYHKDGLSTKCVAGVGEAGSNYVYSFNKGTIPPTPPTPTTVLPTLPGACSSYTILDSGDRSQHYGPSSADYKCDYSLNPGWYRFTGNAGSNMATSCVPQQHCGTHSPGWLNGALPSRFEGGVDRKVCFNWRDNCCFWSINTVVQNCGSFYVYMLDRPPHCRLRYCGDGKQAIATTLPTTTPTTSLPDACSVYTILDTADRAQGQGRLENYKCDDTLTPGWYRFTGSAGSNMATTCVEIFHCGAHSPGWLNGTLPSVSEGSVVREVCFNWKGNCCHWKATSVVRNCGGYHVYRLDKPPNCRLRYCGNSVQVPPKPITAEQTTMMPTTTEQTTMMPTTAEQSTMMPTTAKQTTTMPTTAEQTTIMPTTAEQTTRAPTTMRPTPWAKIRRFIVCQNRKRILRCPFRKRIRVRYANYGRTSRKVCPHFPIRTTRCFSKRASLKIRRKCNGRRVCYLYARNVFFGNPCFGTYKYIQVNYICI